MLTQSKIAMSALTRSRHFGFSHYTAGLLKQKLMEITPKRDFSKPLSYSLQVDDAYWGEPRE